MLRKYLKALVVGYGSIGKRHIDNLSKIPGIQILVLTNQKSDSFLKKRNCIVFSDIKESLTFHPDFAIIANSTEQHVKTAIFLAKIGIHLFIEKPLSNNSKNITILKNLIHKKHLVTFLGSNLRFHPCIQKIHQLLKSNKIGLPLYVYVENGSYLPDWHPHEDYRSSYAANEEKSGGIILTNIHEIDYLYWFFGIPNSVFSMTEKLSKLKISSSDSSNIILKFKNNISAMIHIDFFQKSTFRCCKIIGTKGMLYWDDRKNSVDFFNNKTSKWSTLMNIKNFNFNDTYMKEVLYFISCIKKSQHSSNDIVQSIQTLKIALAIKQSSKLKKMVKVNV